MIKLVWILSRTDIIENVIMHDRDRAGICRATIRSSPGLWALAYGVSDSHQARLLDLVAASRNPTIKQLLVYFDLKQGRRTASLIITRDILAFRRHSGARPVHWLHR